jgi:DNA-binding XRE family transcriptional regulator
MTNTPDYDALAKKYEATDKQLASFYRELAQKDAPASTGSENALHHVRTEFILGLYLARRQKGLTQAELAERVHMSQSSLARIESGKANPTLNTLLKIAKALDVQLHLQPRP